MKNDRDAAIERLLRDRARPAGDPGGVPCLDAATFAAWMDDTLTREERQAA